MISLNDSKKKSPRKQGKPKAIVILGPTASGKSDLAVRLAKTARGKQFRELDLNGAEIISADSRQVYRGLDIGSGKITKKEMRGIRHHLLDAVSPKTVFTVQRYQRLAKKAIAEIVRRGKLPIICGGTGLYIDSVIYELNFPKVPPQKRVRMALEKLSTAELFARIRKLDKATAARIDRHNRRRLVRALEIIHYTGRPIPQIDRSSPYDVLKIGIKISPEKLKENISKRLNKRLKIGMVEEVAKLHTNGLSWKRLDDLGLEYRYISRYLRGLKDRNDPTSPKLRRARMKDLILRESYKYVKRQKQWWKKDKEIKWISDVKKANSLVKKFFEKKRR